MGRRRVALADIEIDDQVIRAGDGVILAAEARDRDDRAFSDPDTLDLTDNPPTELCEAVRQAAAVCPNWAITVQEQP